MFRKTSNQSSLFDAGNYISDALPEDDWSFTFKEKIYPLIDENKFSHLYSETDGRYNASIRLMISLLIFMGLEKLTWRMVEFQLPRRIDWLIATHSEIGKAFIDHTTLFKFYQRLELDDTARELFVEFTHTFREICGTSLKKQRTDSFYIHGWLQILSRYGLFKETIRKFLQALRKQKPGLYENIKGQLSKDYLARDFDLTEKDKSLAHRKISIMARDMYLLVSAFSNHHQVQHYETFKILQRVFTQQCAVKDDGSKGSDPELVIKEKPDKDTINTPHNPEARYVKKINQRITGDKAFVTETCDPENKTQFITDVEVTQSTEHDSKQQNLIQERLIDNHFKPEKQYGDAGFVNGTTILESIAKSIELEGPTAGRSRSFESYQSDERSFDAGDFKTEYDKKTRKMVIRECPGGQVPKDQHISEKTGQLLVHFDPPVCTSCPLQNRCPARIGKRVTTYKVSEAEYIGALRHHQYMEDKDYRKECAIRAGAEALVSELTRGHGMRKSRHKKRSRTKLQLIFAALACNVKRFIEHGNQYGYLASAAV